jgi:AAA family ATP:ADP antiporter
MTAAPGGGAQESGQPDPPKGIVERLLSPIADVHRGEATGALLMTATMFLLLAGYYLLKTAREAFILSEGGAEVKSYSSAGQALLLLVLVPAYGAFASRVNRIQLVQWVTLFFAGNLVLFVLALGGGLRIGIAFYLWLGIFNVMVIAQFWAFAADVYSEEQGKRLFPLIGVGSSLGAWIGSVRAGQVVADVGAPRLLVGGAIALVICVALARSVDRVAARRERTTGHRVAADEKLEAGPSGFQMILSDRYLMLIALLVILLNVVNTSGEYLFGRYVVNAANAAFGDSPESAAARQQFIAQTYSSYFGAINLVGFLLQMFVVSRVFKFLGVARALWIHPIVAFIGYVGMLRAPSFAFIRWVKIADNSLDYSLGNTTKQALWLPTSREAKYKAKQAVDSFCQRLGDVLQAGVVYGGELTSLGITGFAALNLVFVAGWLTVTRGLSRRLIEREAAGGRDRSERISGAA